VPIYALPQEHVFPDPRKAEPSGLIAIGGDLDPGRLLLGYAIGIFPWYSEGQPILWHSPDPRFVLELDRLKISRTLKQRARRRPYELTLDRAFSDVIGHCAAMPRPGQDGTWITGEMEQAYNELHALGFAHSVEAWDDGELVGGLYGVALGRIFFGESMFARGPDASKLCFVALVKQLQLWGFGLLDSQVHTEHVARFGAHDIPREEYLDRLTDLVREPGRLGLWRFEGAPYEQLDVGVPPA
jgi:leucyl/phenylalanyl-tRNA--protein transferase